jgi:hypothetical protein
MIQGFTPGLIGNPLNVNFGGADRETARAGGPVVPYDYREIRPKKQLKEIRKILRATKKKFLFIKYGYKFNIRHRCVVCGSQHEWEVSDPMRPPIPLSEVHKGRPLKGTYCPKHAGFFKQMEMLEQQILAEEHGLEFRGFLPKPRVPGIRRGPIKELGQADITSLIGFGWLIEPPQGTKEVPIEQYTRLMLEIQGKLNQIQRLVPLLEVIENGEK